jgi:hypothetical protein
MALTNDAASDHATSTRRLAINQPFPSPWDPAGRRIGGTVADKARQKTEPDMYAVDRAVCELLRRTRIIQNESSNASELLACFNDLAGLVGWEPRADPRDALRLADLCKQLATLIRSGSWAIWFGRDSNQLPLKSDPTWQEGTSAAEVGYTYVGLRACGAVGWGSTGTRRCSLPHHRYATPCSRRLLYVLDRRPLRRSPSREAAETESTRARYRPTHEPSPGPKSTATYTQNSKPQE